MATKPAFGVGDVVITRTEDLRLRSKPAVSDDSIKYEPTLPIDSALAILEGPVAGSGYWWYRVRLEDGRTLAGGRTEGWVAAGARDGTEWIGTGDTTDVVPAKGWPTVAWGDGSLSGQVVSEWVAGIGRIYLDIKGMGLEPGTSLDLRAQGAYRIGWDCGASGTPDWVGGTVVEGTARAAANGVRIGLDGRMSVRLTLEPEQPKSACPADHPGLVARWARWRGIQASDATGSVILGPTSYEWDS